MARRWIVLLGLPRAGVQPRSLGSASMGYARPSSPPGMRPAPSVASPLLKIERLEMLLTAVRLHPIRLACGLIFGKLRPQIEMLCRLQSSWPRLLAGGHTPGAECRRAFLWGHGGRDRSQGLLTIRPWSHGEDGRLLRILSRDNSAFLMTYFAC